MVLMNLKRKKKEMWSQKNKEANIKTVDTDSDLQQNEQMWDFSINLWVEVEGVNIVNNKMALNDLLTVH